jgi:excisionase family DNA binding protein
MDTSDDRLLTTAETLKTLGVSLSTLKRLVARGELTQVRLHANGRPRYRRSDVQALIAHGGSSST